MVTETVKVFDRDVTGSRKVKYLRKDGFVPAVLYGAHIENRNLKVNMKDMDKFLKRHGSGSSLNLEIDGEKIFALVKDVQRDVVKGKLRHIDFQGLTAGEAIRVRIPLYFVGKGKLPQTSVVQELLHEVELKLLPKDLIESIEVDVSGLEFGEALTIADLSVASNEDIEVLTDLNTTIATLIGADKEIEPEEETDETFEVPVIGEEDDEE